MCTGTAHPDSAIERTHSELLQPLKSINVAEDRKADGHHERLCAGAKRSPSLLDPEAPVAAALQMPLASDAAKLPGYVSWLELQYQHAVSQLATSEAMGVPAIYSSANLPDHSHICSEYPLGLQSLSHSTDTNQTYQSAPAAHMNSLPSKQAAKACQNWVGMSLAGSSAECSGELDGFVAGVGNTDLSPDHLAMLAWNSVLAASSQNFSEGETIHRLTLIINHVVMVDLLVFGTMIMTCMLIVDSKVAKESQVCNLLQLICSFGQLSTF